MSKMFFFLSKVFTNLFGNSRHFCILLEYFFTPLKSQESEFHQEEKNCSVKAWKNNWAINSRNGRWSITYLQLFSTSTTATATTTTTLWEELPADRMNKAVFKDSRFFYLYNKLETFQSCLCQGRGLKQSSPELRLTDMEDH